jgi:anaerobic selenocysteine-containing dehydrogenase
MPGPTQTEDGTTHRSFCRICNAMCGIVVTVGPDRTVEQVRGDPDHPLSAGYTCPKGRALPALHHDPRRLDRPQVGRGPDRRDTAWDDVLDDLHARVRDAVEAHGPDSVAMYLASGSAFDAAGRRAAERFLSVLGSGQRYTATTIDTPCKPLVAELVGGWSGLTPVWDEEGSSLLVLFGSNPVVSHGHSNAMPDPVARLRRFRERGGRLWVLDPRRTETARLADHHLQLRPGTDWLVLGWLVRRLLDDDDARRVGSRTRATGVDQLHAALAPLADSEMVIRRTGLGAADLDALLDAVVAAGRVSALTGTGTSMAATADVTEHLLWALHVVTDSYDRPGGMWFNPGYLGQLDRRDWPPTSAEPPEPEPGPPSRPDLPRRFGEWPCVALLDEIEAGHVTTLFVVGGNPVTAFPDAERTRAALASLDTLVVLDVLPTETTELATHVLPAVDQLERADTTWLLDGYQLAVAGQFTPAVVEPVGERRPVWWAFGALAERLGLSALPRGVTVPDPPVPAAMAATELELLRPLLERSRGGAEVVLAAPSGVVASGPVHGWVHERMLPPGGWRLAPAPLMTALAEAVDGLDVDRVDVDRVDVDRVADPSSGPAARRPALVLVPHRQLRTMNSQLRDIAAPGAATESVEVRVHPSVVAALGLDAGSAGSAGSPVTVTVTSAHGSVEGVLHADDRLHPEAVVVAHGWTGPNVSALTSAADGVDPLTGMPRLGGVPVEVTLAGTVGPDDPST